ncbi:hypothetical protein ACET3Z_007833 [Daucus carota]
MPLPLHLERYPFYILMLNRSILLFVKYSMSDVARQLLEIISDSPTGSMNLLMQVLQTLTDGTVPSPELISCSRKLSI